MAVKPLRGLLIQHPDMRYCVVLFLAISIFSSCARQNIYKQLSQAESCVQSNPDSALALIQTIDTNLLRSHRLHAYYSLLHAGALDKSWIDTTDIGVIMPAVSYYEKHGSPDQKMESFYYLGRIQANGHDYNSAIVSLVRAEAEATASQDIAFKGLLCMAIADIYKKAHHTEKEQYYIEKGMAYFLEGNDTVHYNLSFGRLAMSFQEKREWVMADSLFRKGIELASNDTIAMRMFLVHYAAMKIVQPDIDPKGAVTLIDRAVSEFGLRPSPKVYGIYAYASLLENDSTTTDKILSFLNSLPESRKKEARYYEYLIALHRNDNGHAIDLLNSIYSDQDIEVDRLLNNSITAILKDYYQLQAVEADQQSHTQRLVTAVVILGLSLLFFIIIVCLVRKREKERFEFANMIKFVEETNSMLVQSKSSLEKKCAVLQQSYIQLFKNQFETINSLTKTFLKHQGKSEDTRKTAIYGKVKDILAFIGKDKKQHILFEEQINRDLNNIVSRLKADLGEVSDENSRFICYTIAGFDPNVIAILLGLSLSNVYTKRFRLKERIRQLDSPYKKEYLQVV